MKFGSGAIGRQLARQALKLDKNSPTILFGAGVAGVIGSTVLACRATLKLEDVLNEAEKNLKIAKTLEHREYSEKDRASDISLIYVKTSVNVLKLYAPAIILGGASIAALAQSHNILTKRNAALTAAYAALEKGFAEYRQRVVDKYGEEEDRNFRYGSREVDVLQDGDKKTVTRVGTDSPSIYARFFDQLSPNWSKEPEYNLIFIRGQQNYLNDLLRSRGHVFLNDAYDELGIPRSKAGAVVGWILIGDYRDNYIDFGIFEGETQVARDFVNGREGAILLDFNVDGVIYDKIDTPKEALSWQLDR
jgi:hypothetical protein